MLLRQINTTSAHLDLVTGQIEVDEVDEFPEPLHLHYVVVGEVEHPQGVHPCKPVHPHQLVVGNRQLQYDSVIWMRMDGAWDNINKKLRKR